MGSKSNNDFHKGVFGGLLTHMAVCSEGPVDCSQVLGTQTNLLRCYSRAIVERSIFCRLHTQCLGGNMGSTSNNDFH